jgi:hypothetical protein
MPTLLTLEEARGNSDQLTWIGGNGDFSNPAQCRPESAPGPRSFVRFAGEIPLKVSFSAPASILALEVNTKGAKDAPCVTLNLAGGNLRVGDENDKQTAFLRLNSTPDSGSRTLAITGGTLWCPVASISVNPNSAAPPSRILVTEKGRFESLRYIYVGNKGEGILEISGEGEVDSKGYLRVAEGEGSKGKVILDGPQALLVCGSATPPRSGLAFIGGRGEGLLEVKNGAKVRGLLIQAARGSANEPAGKGNGKIHIVGRDSSLVCEQLFIGGGRSNLQKVNAPVRDGIGELHLSGGGDAEAEEFSVFAGSKLQIDTKSNLVVAPKRNPGNPAMILHPDSTLEVILEPSGEQAPVRVSGQVQIDGAKLQLVAGTASSSPDKSIRLLDYTGGSLSGTFQGLAEGGQITAPNGRIYTIKYGLDGSNLVMLTTK